MRNTLILPFFVFLFWTCSNQCEAQIAIGSQHATQTAKSDTIRPSGEKRKPDGRTLISASAGPAWLGGTITTRSPEFADRHIESLESGLVLTGEIVRQSKGGFGIGLRYSGYRSDESSDVTYSPEQGPEIEVNLTEKLRIHFLGAILVIPVFDISTKSSIEGRLLIGQSFYRNEGSWNDGFTITGTGAVGGVGAAWKATLDERLHFFFCFESLFGRLKTYELTTPLQSVTIQPDREKQGALGHHSVSAGLRLNF